MKTKARKQPEDHFLLGLVQKSLVPRTPKRITPQIRDFCRQLGGGDLIWITICPTGKMFKCQFNAQDYADQVGGNVVRGWTVWEMPGVYLYAEDHAVTEKEGVYHDTTPHFDGSHRVLFLGQRLVAGLEPIQPCHWYPLSTKSQVVRACQKYREGSVNGEGCHLNYSTGNLMEEGDRLIAAHQRYTKSKNEVSR